MAYLNLSAPIDFEILEELYKAAEHLGADAIEIRTGPAEALYATLEALGADRHLLAVVGSWQKGLPDADVLRLLKLWNEHGKIDFDPLFAGTERRPKPAKRQARVK